MIDTLVFSVIKSFTKKYKWLQLWICGYLQNCSREWKGTRDPRGFGSVRYVRFSKIKKPEKWPKMAPRAFSISCYFFVKIVSIFLLSIFRPPVTILSRLSDQIKSAKLQNYFLPDESVVVPLRNLHSLGIVCGSPSHLRDAIQTASSMEAE